MTEHSRAIIDYAYNDEGTQVRDAIYSAIQNKVMAHLEMQKQRIAHNLLTPQEEQEYEEDEEQESENT